MQKTPHFESQGSETLPLETVAQIPVLPEVKDKPLSPEAAEIKGRFMESLEKAKAMLQGGIERMREGLGNLKSTRSKVAKMLQLPNNEAISQAINTQTTRLAITATLSATMLTGCIENIERIANIGSGFWEYLKYGANFLKVQVTNTPFPPFGEWQWEGLFWPFWMILMTQPKVIDKGWQKIKDPLSKLGGYINAPGTTPGVGAAFDFIWGIPFIGPVLKGWYYVGYPPLGGAIPVHIASLIANRYPEAIRLATSVSAANYLSKNQMEASVGAIAMSIIWFLFLRSKEHEEELKEARDEYGYIFGTVYQGIRDYLPQRRRWKCKGPSKKKRGGICGKKNKLNVICCTDCGTENPKADWNCKKEGCEKKGISYKAKCCPGCGTERPGKAAQIATETGSIALEAPREGQEVVVCSKPDCGAPLPANANFCGSCQTPVTRQKSLSTKQATSRTTNRIGYTTPPEDQGIFGGEPWE